MPHLATTGRLAALLLVLATPVLAQTSQTHNTGTVTLQVFDDGIIGADASFPANGFIFNGAGGLYEGQLVVGASAAQVSGQPYSRAAGSTTPHEWTDGGSVTAITPPAPYNQAFQSQYTDAIAPNPIGLSVTQRSYSSNVAPNNDFVVVEFNVANTSASALSGIHIGLFSDFDVAAFATNNGGFDAATQSVYVNSTAATAHFGVTVLCGNASGYELDTGAGFNPTEAEVYLALTTPGLPTAGPTDIRTVIGTGPYSIPVGGSATARFAYVAGTNTADFLANAAAARALCPTVANEEGPGATSHVLRPAFPNPTRGASSVRFTLPQAEQVRLAVYDLMGRQVLTLVDEVRGAGEHTVAVDAGQLPAGTYVVRLQAGGTVQTQRLVVTK